MGKRSQALRLSSVANDLRRLLLASQSKQEQEGGPSEASPSDEVGGADHAGC